MGKIKTEYPHGATPLDPNEMNGLIPDYISTQSELNKLEQENILSAEAWLQKKKLKWELSDHFVREVHARMFCDVWKWAGKFRKSGKNIGVSAEKVPEELRKLCDDTKYWIANEIYGWDELGARFHHRLVWIHAFPNGNGRHARLITDALLQRHGQDTFTWGMGRSVSIEQVRAEYLAALKEADEKRMGRLVKFVRS